MLVNNHDKAANLQTAAAAVAEAAEGGAQLVMLPECWNSPYDSKQFPRWAEEVPASASQATVESHPSTHTLCAAARENGVFLIGGSIPEREGDRVYNTCLVISPDGEIICKHRKMHLFDISVPGGITFRESETLTGGDTLSLFDTPWGRIGVGICYDMRFPQLALLLRQAGAHLLCYPGAFNLTTGPAHWELLGRARAVDNQVFVATPSPARSPPSEPGYKAWGHSTVYSPWGTVLATTEHDAAIIYADVELAEVEAIRAQIPIGVQKRDDLYSVSWHEDL